MDFHVNNSLAHIAHTVDLVVSNVDCKIDEIAEKNY